MAFKTFEVPPIGTVKIYRRHGGRNLRLSMTADGTVRVTMPYWTPYKAGLAFVQQQKLWIKAQQKPPMAITDDSVTAGNFRVNLHRQPLSKPRTRLIGTTLHVYLSPNQEIKDPPIQNLIKNAAERALKNKAEEILIPRLSALSIEHGLDYSSAGVKRLKSRWGSCSSRKAITLNSHLIQLPPSLIDYVILHELTHTRELNHSKKFYELLGSLCPNYKALRKELHTHKPSLIISES